VPTGIRNLAQIWRGWQWRRTPLSAKAQGMTQRALAALSPVTARSRSAADGRCDGVYAALRPFIWEMSVKNGLMTSFAGSRYEIVGRQKNKFVVFPGPDLGMVAAAARIPT
jgi:hypothetical protein